MARKSRKPEALQAAAPIITEVVYSTATYSRLSVMDSGKKDGEGILNQQELLEQYIKQHPELDMKASFVDNGESGVDFVRPAWNDLMRECRAGNINCIVIKDLSRLGRNYIETGEYLEKIFPLLGIRLIAVNDGYDNLNLTTGERLVSNLKNLVNDIYAKDISRKSSAALQTKQKQGAFIGTYASYGYLKDLLNKNKIIVDPETAPIVRQIYEWKAEGLATAVICRKLTETGIPAPNHYRLLKGIVKDERYAKSQWSAPIVKLILTNPMYLGHMTQNRQVGALYEGKGKSRAAKKDWVIVENTHEPIVSRELFDRANAVIESRTAAYKEKQGVYAHIEAPEMLLKGLVFCADCGRPLFRYKKVRDNRVYWTYQCRNHSNLKACPLKYIHEKDLYGAVYEAIRAEIQKCADVMGIIEKLNAGSSHKERLAAFDKEIAETEKELQRIASLRQAIYDDYAAKLLTVSEYQFATEKYAADIDNLRQRLEVAKREKSEYTQNSTPVNKWLVAFRRFTDAKELTADMARALIERIEVSERNRVEIIFKFRDEYAAVYGHTKEVA